MRYRHGGFTLIELLVIIMIIAIISGIAVPAYTHYYDRAVFDQRTNEVLSLLSWAREKAKSSGAGAIVQYDQQSRIFIVNVNNEEASTDQPVALTSTVMDSSQNIGGMSGSNQETSRSLMLDDTTQASDFQPDIDKSNMVSSQTNAASNSIEIQFHPDGTADGMQFSLLSLTGLETRIQIMPATGRATIYNDTASIQ